MAVYQADRYRCIAVLVSSYRKAFQFRKCRRSHCFHLLCSCRHWLSWMISAVGGGVFISNG